MQHYCVKTVSMRGVAVRQGGMYDQVVMNKRVNTPPLSTSPLHLRARGLNRRYAMSVLVWAQGLCSCLTQPSVVKNR